MGMSRFIVFQLLCFADTEFFFFSFFFLSFFFFLHIEGLWQLLSDDG